MRVLPHYPFNSLGSPPEGLEHSIVDADSDKGTPLPGIEAGMCCEGLAAMASVTMASNQLMQVPKAMNISVNSKRRLDRVCLNGLAKEEVTGLRGLEQ